jgi:mycofactocin precursor
MMEPSTVSPDADLDTPAADDVEPREPQTTLVEEELLVEDVSIDGMCGVY